ncbi:MAG: DUF2284 domain-containing protein [Coprobacillus sp.]
MTEDIFKHIIDKYKYIELIKMNPSDLVFEERVKMNCFYCGKYGNNWKCPPNIPEIEYKNMVFEYNQGYFVVLKMPLTKENYDEVRTNSSIVLHRACLDIEKFLWKHNDSTSISFIGGSCKLCKTGCGLTKCNSPYMSRTPLEAIGVSVNKSIEKYGIELIYPPVEYMYRIGLVLFD